MKKHSVWKLVGLAGLAGVAATGVVLARAERERRSYSPEEIRSRLHDRVAAMEADRQRGLGQPRREPPSPLRRPRRNLTRRWLNRA